jgi:phenylalanyl-tRNA synthetase beta chain
VPKIEVDQKIFFKQIGKKFTRENLIDILETAKAELDEVIEDQGILKIELNDTNRPDLWSSLGLARHIRTYLEETRPSYKFLSTPTSKKTAASGRKAGSAGKQVIVDKKLKSIRPYIAAFIASGHAIDDAGLIDLIQMQEKLCGNYGRKRKSIAMGVYRSDLITYPVTYIAADPDKTRFTPLGLDKELSLREILTEHPKGVEFGPIIAAGHYYPYLRDGNGEALSLPPVINSATLGAVEVGDKSLFVELTGTEIDTLLLACSIVACNLADSGYTIEPVTIEYPYETPYGTEIVTPCYFQKPVKVKLSAASKILGEKIGAAEALACLKRMGNGAQRDAKSKDIVILNPPPFRNDFMHPVDVIEEIMMGRGLASFAPVFPEAFTLGRLSPQEEFSRKARDVMVGLGFQEMIYNYLGSRQDIIEKMNTDGADALEISNPMTENYEVVRNSILPNLLYTESISANAVYPHKVFEAGRIARRDAKDNYGSVTRQYLSFLIADRAVGFNELSADVAVVLYYLSREYTLEPLDDPRFIKGRAARVLVDKKSVGVMGELHPAVLTAWGVQTPCAAAELDLDVLMR